MRAAASLYLPVLLILIFAGENGGFQFRPIEQAQTAAPMVFAELSSLNGSFKATVTGSGRGMLKGDALLRSESENGIHVHNMALFAREDEASCRDIQFSRLHEQLPQEGMYVLDDVDARNDVQALYYEVSDGELTALCGPSGGSFQAQQGDARDLPADLQLER